jgi:uncharacterized protein (TIGR00369 family)
MDTASRKPGAGAGWEGIEQMLDLRSLTPSNPNFAEATRRFLMAMPIAQHLGFEITAVEPGRFEITQPYRRELSFRDGVFQAGPIGTLADMAGACASATMLPADWACSTIDYTLKLLAAAAGSELVARGRLLKYGRTLSVAAADVHVVRDGSETICATALISIRNFAPAGPPNGRNQNEKG